MHIFLELAWAQKHYCAGILMLKYKHGKPPDHGERDGTCSWLAHLDTDFSDSVRLSNCVHIDPLQRAQMRFSELLQINERIDAQNRVHMHEQKYDAQAILLANQNSTSLSMGESINRCKPIHGN